MFLGGGAVSVSANELGEVTKVDSTSSLESGGLVQPDVETPLGEEVPTEASLETSSTPTPNETQPVYVELETATSEVVQPIFVEESAIASESIQETVPTDELTDAKTVLEQVISEAEVLASEALRQAAKSTEDTSSLVAAANATKTVAASANSVFADAAASLEAVNAQITAIRTSVDNLASQLYSFTGSDTLTAMLNATSSTPTAADEEDKKLIAAILDDYTANTQQTVAYDAAAIPGSALVVVQSGTGPDYTYTYKRFAEATTLTKESIKTAFDAGEFKTAADFKAAATYASDKPTVDEKVYVFTEASLSQATSSLEESYDLTKFQHRKHLLFNPNDLALGALARPGTFSLDIEMISSGGTSYDPSRYILKENNTLLLVETPTGTYYYDMANPPDYVNENYDSYYYKKQYAYNEYNLFLSHIEDYGVSNQPNDLLNKSNSNLDLPPGVSLVFKAADGSEIRADNKEAIDQYIKAATANMWDDSSGEIKKGVTSQLEFKFIVEKDGQVIKQDDNWRSVTLHADGDLLNAITTKTDNTPNDFAAGIVDNIDFSGLPTELKEQAVEMEKTTQNLDGTTPVDGQLPTFSNPENKNVKWVKQVGEYLYSLQDNEHGTSPFRVLPNYTDLFTDPTLIKLYIRY